jgi:hypothetical protein
MKIYDCACGATLFFENVQCLSCRRELGFLPDRQTLSALEPGSARETWHALAVKASYRKCQNYARERVCNWLVAPGDDAPFCVACRLNETIPDLSAPGNRVAWAKLEAAKRRLVYSLLALKLPIVGRAQAPENGLAFAFLRDAPAGDAAGKPVMTGHANGLITINAIEANDADREEVRERLHERYRTLLGHFRHEIGHYYWTKLVEGSEWMAPFRALFGDEREDYGAALQRHYTNGPTPDWQKNHISVYASAHPWEDWAETWAHYLHIVDTIETAAAFGVKSSGKAKDRIDEHLFPSEELRAAPRNHSAELASILRDWVWLTLATNSINRSMGMRDVYPFVLNAGVVAKLQLVHAIILRARAGAHA